MTKKWRVETRYQNGKVWAPDILINDPKDVGGIVGWLDWTAGGSVENPVKEFAIIPMEEKKH